MKIYAPKQVVGLAALLVVVDLVAFCADEPARGRGATINFSAPKSDAGSTNLNELRTPVSPFQSLEATLKSPFETPQKTPSGQSFRDNRKFLQQNQTVNRKPLKDQLNRRAEEMFLNPEQFEGDEGNDAFFQLSKDSLDPYQKKPKNSLERYNDRQERDRMVLTNQSASRNLFGEKNPIPSDAGRGDSRAVKPLKVGGFADDDRSDSLSAFPRATTNGSSLNPERSGLTRNSDGFTRPIEDPIARRSSDAGARMEDFKRLLEGSRYTPPATPVRSSAAASGVNFSATTSGNSTASRAAAISSPSTEWSSFKPAAKEDPRDEFATSAGLVGKLEKPHSLPEFPVAAKTLSPVTTAALPEPTPVKKVPHSTFKVPQRRF